MEVNFLDFLKELTASSSKNGSSIIIKKLSLFPIQQNVNLI